MNIVMLLKGPIAESLIRSAQKTGGWVCLQNVHLATLWTVQLEVICDSFNASTVNSEFRLWLTSHSSNKVPECLLKNINLSCAVHVYICL